MKKKIDVTIRIEKSHADRIDEIVDALKGKGLTDVESHARFMVVSGRVEVCMFDELRRVKGVASVREDRTYKLQSP